MREVVKLRSHIHAGNVPLLDVVQDHFRFHYEKQPGIRSVDWRRRKRNGEVVMNNHQQVIGFAEPFQVDFTLRPVDVKEDYDPPPTVIGHLVYTPPDPFGTARAFLNEHLQKLDTTSAIARANSPELDMLTQLGEARESISMVKQLIHAARHPVATFVETAESIFKSPIHAYRNGLSLLADLRLLWRYGINPYYQQIKDLLDDIKVRRFSRIQWGDFSYTEKIRSEIPVSPAVLSDEYSDIIQYDQQVTYSSHQVLKLALTLDQVLDKFFSFSVPQTVWELTRFSFVVDWFVNVGDFIAAYEDTLNVYKSGAACITHLVIVDQPVFLKPVPGIYQIPGVLWYKYQKELSATGQSQLIFYDRTVTNRPKEYIRLGWSDNFDLTHQLDALALGWQQIRDKAVSQFTLLKAEDASQRKAAQATLTNHLEFSAALKNNTTVLARKRPIKRK